MTNSSDLESGLPIAMLTDLDAMYVIRAPALLFSRPLTDELPQANLVRRHWRSLAVATVAATVALGAFFLIPATWGGEIGTVNAQEILNRAAGAAQSPAAYHRTYQSTYFAGPNPNVPYQVQIGEVWYRDATHLRFEIRDGSAEGTPGRLLTGYVRNGDDSWYYFDDGLFRVMHSSDPDSEFSKNTFTSGFEPLPNLQSALETYEGGCGKAPELGPETEIAGRAAYIVKSCGATLWIDRDSFFVLKVTYEPTTRPPVATATETGISRIDLNDFTTETTGFDWDIEIPDATFDYQPPPGAIVTEQD